MPCRPVRLLRCLAPLALLVVLASAGLAADEPGSHLLLEGQLSDDARLGPLVNLNGYFPLEVPATSEAWHKRADTVRRQLLVALGLWPMPEKTPLNAVVHGRVDRDQYTVDRVYFESYPGFFVTGSLYKPKGKQGRLPVVLCPHGHWPNGRFFDQTKQMPQQLVSGAERFEVGGRSPLQSRCVQLARMGCIVFHYDMVGYADSVQLAHRPGPRPAMNTLTDWGYHSPQADLHLQNIMGLQTYNSIRALDWLCSLPDVDTSRIGVTGASGGGTQTFILGAVDPRPTVAFPAVMVSTAMQGGCTCENACYLRIGTGNVEIAGLFAPKPLGMSGANDWTKEIETKGLPELQRLYAMLGAKDKVMAKALVQFPHNYNYVSRAVMYSWFNKHLKLGLKDPIVEADYEPLSIAEMTVWDDKHPQPPSGDDFERKFLRRMTADSQRQLADLTPRDAASLEKYRKVVGGAVDVLIGRKLPSPGEVEGTKARDDENQDYALLGLIMTNAGHKEHSALAGYFPKDWNRKVVIWVDERGKQVLFTNDGWPRDEVKHLLKAGYAVVSPDLIGQGEFTQDGKPWTKARLAKGGSGTAKWDEYACYTYGYNYSLFAQRVHDLLNMISCLRDNPISAGVGDGPADINQKAKAVYLYGAGPAAAWVAAARAQAGSAVDRAAIDTRGFRFARINAIDDPNYLPGVLKYGDLPALLALSAPQPLWLAGEGSTAPELTDAAYRAAGASKRLVVSTAAEDRRLQDALDWLVEKN